MINLLCLLRLLVEEPWFASPWLEKQSEGDKCNPPADKASLYKATACNTAMTLGFWRLAAAFKTRIFFAAVGRVLPTLPTLPKRLMWFLRWPDSPSAAWSPATNTKYHAVSLMHGNLPLQRFLSILVVGASTCDFRSLVTGVNTLVPRAIPVLRCAAQAVLMIPLKNIWKVMNLL